MTERLHFHFSLSGTGEGNGNPLQCSCLENSKEGEPGGLPSMGSHRVGHDGSNLAAAAAAVVKNLSANAEGTSSIIGSGRASRKEKGNPLQHLAWEIPRTDEPGGQQSVGLQESNVSWRLNHHHHKVHEHGYC